MARIKVHRNTPAEAGTGYAEILQAGLDEVVDHLVDAGSGLQEVGILQQILHPVSVLAEPEEVCLFLCILHLSAAVGALAVHQLALGPEGLTGLAVLALVGSLVDVAVFVHLLEDLLNGCHLVVIGGS